MGDRQEADVVGAPLGFIQTVTVAKSCPKAHTKADLTVGTRLKYSITANDSVRVKVKEPAENLLQERALFPPEATRLQET